MGLPGLRSSAEQGVDEGTESRFIRPDSFSTRQPMRAWAVYGLGSLALVFSAYFGTYAYVVVQALLWTQTSLLRGPVVLLCLFALLNLLLCRVARRLSLSRAELLTLYGMLCMGTCAGGIGFVQFLVNQLPAPYYYASASNRWAARLWPHIPAWLAPHDTQLVRGFFRGHSTLYQPAVLRMWSVPVLAWSGFIFAIFWVLLCATALLRRQWVEEERLTFPLVLLPLQMSEMEPGGFWGSRAMWAGFLVAGALESVNFLSYLFPAIPTLPIKPVGPNQLDVYLTASPWNAAGMFRLAFYPFAIGIAYLLSLEVSFSCWFFYLLVKAANIACAAMGFAEVGGSGAANRAPYIKEQSLGAFIAIAVFSVWMARRSIARAWSGTRSGGSELLPGRVALLGGAAGTLFLVGFLRAAGLALPLAILFVAVYLCFAVTLARIVSEAGAGWAWAPLWSPTDFTLNMAGADQLSARDLVILQGFTAWTSDMRDNPMPQQMQAAKLAQAGGFHASALAGPLVWASAFGILCAFWAHLHIYYVYGAATAKVRPWLTTVGSAPFQQAATLLSVPTPRDLPGLGGAAAGAAIAMGLSLLRLRLPWWPLHPLGYALAVTSSMDYMWCPFFLAWLAKWLTVRYGGIRVYRRLLPFALGLILGDYVVPAFWGLYGMLSGAQQYLVFPH